jgi:hypothetical protein
MSARFLHLVVLGAAVAFAVPALAKEAPEKHHREGFAWENAVIRIEISGKEYSYVQPWARAERKVSKTGVVVGDRLIITTADGLNDQTLIRLQKQGGGLYSLARVVWIDYQSNLAALTSDESDFWTGITPASLADPVPATGPIHVLRWNDDRLENRPGDIERMTVDNSALSFVSVPALKVDSTISSAVSGEPVTQGDKLLGLSSGQDNDVVTAVPSSFISSILNARKHGSFSGLGYFDFTWEPVQNPLSLQYLGLAGPARGVIVKDTGLKPGVTSLIHTRDVILSIDGFDIDSEGDYADPQYGKIMLENLSSRGKWAGQTCQIKVWRDGKEQTITYTLPLAEYSDELVPEQSFDHPPDYVLAGGFVFVQLSDAFLRSWGPTWRQRAPFRLGYYETEKVKPDRPQRIILSGVLPARVNLGYEMLHDAVLDEVNGVKIGKMADLVAALKTPVNGFDVFKFTPADSTQLAVLDASEIDDANQEIMTRFHIPTDHVINPPPATASTP